MARPTFKEFKKKALARADVKAEYDSLNDEFDLMEKFIQARKEAGLSQKELAQQLDTQQPAIARLELGGLEKATFETLVRYAHAVGCRLTLNLHKIKGCSKVHLSHRP